MRLNRYLASATGISRRAADVAISDGRVQVNGEVGKLGDQVVDEDVVMLDNQVVNSPTGPLYVVLNKPVGYVCSRRQQGQSPTIYNLLPERYHTLKPIGRLDRDTSGLLLLTDDGKTAFELTHPSFHKQKTYDVTLSRNLKPNEIKHLKSGVELEDGRSQFDSLEGEGNLWQVVLHEGRNRQIRRTFAAVGAKVVALHRTTLGKLNLDGLAQGQFRLVSRGEIT